MQENEITARPATSPVPTSTNYPDTALESPRSAVSWGAVVAGAVISAALMITLIVGGTGLGFLVVSPWQSDGASGGALAIGTIIWLFVTQIITYGIAGYVAGRLRTKWTDVRSDEIYFRDTAHGFLVWALSSLVGVVLLSSAAASIVSGTTKAGVSLVGASAGAVSTAAGPALSNSEMDMGYFTDALMRPDETGIGGGGTDNRQEITTILTRSITQGELSADDQNYLISVVAQNTGMSETEARARVERISTQAQESVDELESKARQVADEARKAAAIFSLWAFASLLLGAFVASLAATRGGRARDV